MLLIVLPLWPYSSTWGFWPSGIVLLLLLLWLFLIWFEWLVFAHPWAGA